FMGVLVAKTHSRWGRFRPWLFTGTILNAVVLYALFAAPNLEEAELMVYFSIVYILWGITYTMMDIPYWSMIPAVTKTSADRENLSVVGRTCAGVGSALIAMFTMLLVGALGGDSERAGFRWVALIVAGLFVISEVLCCVFFKEKSQTKMETAGVKDMFTALFRNDQAMVVVLSIVLINSALYLTSNFVIYFFKYDFGGANWKGDYTLFSTVGGAAQILGMMVLYPLLRKALSNTKVFVLSIITDLAAYAILLAICLFGFSGSLPLLFIPGVLIFACNGMLSVLTTLFLSNSVDYGQLKTGRREESVIFSMQTFVVKAASGIAVFLTGIGLDIIGLQGNTDDTADAAVQTPETLVGLRLMMTVLPFIVLAIALILFNKKFKLTDEKVVEIAQELKAKEQENDE
ncbi:MAG: glycoside-pentoside-hexuronide (GPH):cation symporter, partial [Ruminiclostridium sp.]|nr:glycoside-pentoside-hexuronide (GPH):cation symporter [Ruminiclostridium sp.]